MLSFTSLTKVLDNASIEANLKQLGRRVGSPQRIHPVGFVRYVKEGK